MMGSCVHWRTVSIICMPSISGRPRSSTTRSGQCELIIENASLPERARMTSYPLELRIARMKPEMLFFVLDDQYLILDIHSLPVLPMAM